MNTNKKDRLLISFSGGETSGFMTSLLLKNNPYKETVVLFANTGQESEATLKFVDLCDKHFNFNVVWLETKDILAEAKLPFEPFVDGYRVTIANFNEDLDSAGACSESCEVF